MELKAFFWATFATIVVFSGVVVMVEITSFYVW
jgi:hypothetical protein